MSEAKGMVINMSKFQTNLVTETANEYIDWIIFLEKNIGSKIKYIIFEPSSICFYDVVSLQNVAKKLSSFIGIEEFIFIISSSKQSKGFAGNIELNKDKEVYIEISSELISNHQAVFAVLAHEVTHKYMQLNKLDISTQSVQINEVLTDIASIYLGFGKIVLNGCLLEEIKEEYIANEKIVKTYKTNLGYIGLEHFAFIYLIVCKMRGISESEYLKGLNQKALSAISAVMSNFSLNEYLNEKFHDNSYVDTIINESKKQLNNYQKVLVAIEYDVWHISNAYVNNVNSFLTDEHRVIAKKCEEIYQQTTNIEYNRCFSYLKYLKLTRSLSEFNKQDKIITSCNEINKDILKIIKQGNFYLEKGLINPLVITCRNDNTKIIISQNPPDSLVKCPVCKYEFYIGNYFNSSSSSYETQSSPKNSKLKSIIKNVFSKH